MLLSRLASLLALVLLVAVPSVPVAASAAAPPRVVALAELAIRTVEVGITSKHLTLIHFETGDVSMVAVGDPTIVGITVRGPDVLLKALGSSGSTNAFIWQGGHYTQWTFTVRPNGNDAHLVIVRDLVSTARDEPTNNGSDAGKDETPSAAAIAGAAASGPPAPATSTSAATSVPTPASPQQPSAGGTQQPSGFAGNLPDDACGPSAPVDQFIKTLSVEQRELLTGFLAQPTLASLQALVRELDARQRCEFLSLLSAPPSSNRSAPNAVGSSAPASAPSSGPVFGMDETQRGTAADQPGSGRRSSGAAALGSAVPSAVVFSVTPDVIDGQLFLHYVLENRSQATLLTDILRLRIVGGSGKRVAFGIKRAARDGYLGRLEAGGVEYGMIGVETGDNVLHLEWTVITLGSGAPQILQAEVQVP